MKKKYLCHQSVIETHYCDDMSDCQYGQPNASAGYEKLCLCFFKPGKTMEERIANPPIQRVSRDSWNAIEDIIGDDEKYESFRTRTKRFMTSNSITVNKLSIDTGLSRPILTSFLQEGYRKLSFRTLSKLINYMEDYAN